MIPTYLKAELTTVQTFFFVLLLFLSSCSKDDVYEIFDNEVNGEKEVPIIFNAAELADDFNLDRSNRVVNYILPKSEYDKYLEDEGDFSMISKKVYWFFDAKRNKVSAPRSERGSTLANFFFNAFK